MNKIRAIAGILIVILGLVFFIGVAPVSAEDSVSQSDKMLPQPNENGDYVAKSDHLYWQVVDPDPNGLNCRMGDASVEEVWNPDNPGFPAINTWPAVTTLSENEVFKAQRTYGGFVFTFDDQRQPWIFIKTKQDGTPANCFVRANSALVQPIVNTETKEETAVEPTPKPEIEAETIDQPIVNPEAAEGI